MKKISIIIVTYNSDSVILDCVRSIKKQTDIPLSDIELIVVDNCSINVVPMFEQLRSFWGDDIILMKNTRNGGYGQGNNVGISRATAPIVLIMNPDVRLLSVSFSQVLESFESDSRLAMYGMKQMMTLSKPSMNSFFGTFFMNGYIRTFLTGICNRVNWFIPQYMCLSGACFYVRCSMMKHIGMFDENVFMYGEEDDIHNRLSKEYGYHIMYNSRMSYLHPVENRIQDVCYLQKLLAVERYYYKKRGMSERCCLVNNMRRNNLIFAREYLRKWTGRNFSQQRFDTLRSFRYYLSEEMRKLQ